MKLEEGMYVKTKEGTICKLLRGETEEHDEYLDFNDIHSPCIRKSHVVKSSYNIIDLLQEGDIVELDNGYCVAIGTMFETLKFFSTDGDEYLYSEIKSIVTHEQFEYAKYEIGETYD